MNVMPRLAGKHLVADVVEALRDIRMPT